MSRFFIGYHVRLAPAREHVVYDKIEFVGLDRIVKAGYRTERRPGIVDAI
jgi:hypothetical protein